ncbi:related to Sterol 3-beta-glucosyltransferase [Zygosaccharomyces bailii]|nr:related to Sterol 3-beta-glucosyltransferase [Zygosaccharomyces bailii]
MPFHSSGGSDKNKKRPSLTDKHQGVSLSPTKSVLSGLGNVKHMGLELAPAFRVDTHKGDTENSDGHDTARGRYALKSIVGLLTAASVVCGMRDQQRASDVAQDLDDGEGEESYVDASSEPEENDERGSNKQEGEEAVDISRVQTGNEEKLSPETLTTGRSLGFDLSVEPLESASGYNSKLDESIKKDMIDRLVQHFDLGKDEFFAGDFPSFLLRDVLVQGQLFLTSMHLLFFAYLPSTSDQVQLSGNLNVHSRIRGSTRYWAVLRDQSLSLYNSPTEIYFPEMVLDLKTTVSIIAIQNKHTGKPTKSFKIETKRRSFTFSADSEFSAKSWCNALKRQHFAAQNADNDSVSLKIPLVNIVEVVNEPIVGNASTLRLKTLESSRGDAVIEFVFVFLNSSSAAVKKKVDTLIRNLERSGLPALSPTSPDQYSVISDSTDYSSAFDSPEKSDLNALSPCKSPGGHHHHLHLLPRFHRHHLQHLHMSSSCTNVEDNSAILSRDLSNSPSKQRARSTSGGSMVSPVKHVVGDVLRAPETFVQELNISIPSISVKSISQPTSSREQSGSSLNADSSLADASNKNQAERESKKSHWHHRHLISELWNNKPLHYRNESVPFDDSDHYLVSPEDNERANSRFRKHFHLGEHAKLVSAYFAYLSRNVPLYGKVYLSDDMMGFRSLLPGTHTKMNLPLVDIEDCYKESGFSFGYEGLILVVRGHEELCFEFSSTEARDDAQHIISERMKLLKKENVTIMSPTTNILETDSNIAKMKLIEDKINAEGIDAPLVLDQNPYYETSIKPEKKFKVGLLTIGSRGDVQPYIALGKGLQKEGHNVIIITHGEFRGFVESHGIEFDEIAGNPAELMSFMVEHESLNVGLLKDASSRFRKWIAELLVTSWKACRKAELDILIESPSAMAGIHIAEALQIPYFRAFTMPWTRTRAYPHAFIVPDQPRGGNYNYMTHVLFENIFWKGISGQVNKWRVETLHLDKTSLELMQQNKVPFFYNVSPTIFPPAIDFCEWIRVTGYWFLDEKQNYTPPEGLQRFINRARKLNKKLVYIGFGSIVVSNAKEMTQAISEAVVDADVFCILNKGWSDRLSDRSNKNEIEVPLPDCIYNAGSVPHDWLFPQMDVAVHHGGSGTTGASLKAGCPTIVKPFFGDQYFYATRVEDIGAGLALKKLNKKTLSRALKEATTSGKMKERAAMIKERISHEDGVKTAINCIYTELEYAKSLVVAKKKNNSKEGKNRLEIAKFSAPRLPELNLEKSFTFL